MLTFVINNTPVPWSAHQGYGRKSFNPRYKEREYYRWQIKSQYNQDKPILGPIRLSVQFHMPIPKGTSSIRRKQMLAGLMCHIKRPDLDNLNKFLCDCLKTIVFEDDSQVVEINAKKIFGENPKTVIQLL